MLFISTPETYNENEMAFKKRALQDAVICIGWLKLISTICYVCLYFLVRVNSKGNVSDILQIMILVIIPLQIFHGVVLFFGALESKVEALEIGLWLCLILASYNTVLGVMGFIYFIRTGHYTVHFFLAVVFGILGLSLLTVMCHDILIVYACKQVMCHPQWPRQQQQRNRQTIAPVTVQTSITYQNENQ